ncbi:SIS domain protein, partial [Bordetella holmesii H620]
MRWRFANKACMPCPSRWRPQWSCCSRPWPTMAGF